MAAKIIFYNWDKINAKCAGDFNCILKTFRSKRPLPPGRSFMVNLGGVIQCKSSLEHKIAYIYLASLRNFFDYQYRKDLTLPTYYADIPLSNITNNSLLTIEHDSIIFKYEEN